MNVLRALVALVELGARVYRAVAPPARPKSRPLHFREMAALNALAREAGYSGRTALLEALQEGTLAAPLQARVEAVMWTPPRKAGK